VPRDDFKYQAGVCNIDAKGIKYRRHIGWLTGFIGLAVLAVLFYYRIDPVIRFITTAGFAAGAALNFIQANEHFCVTNAFFGTYETGFRWTNTNRSDEEAAKDRKKMLGIILKTLVTALAAGSFGLLPL
jgi:hypothetical protein